MRFNNNDEDTRYDFFDGPDIPETPKAPKPPVYTPEDPEYWDQPESDWEHLKPRRPFRRLWIWVAGIVVIIGFIVALWLRFFSPYIEESVQYGYVDNVEIRGTIFKTYEGVLIPYKDIMDTTRIYSRDFFFSCDNNEIYTTLKRLQRSGVPVRVQYNSYHAIVPWRGASKIVVTAVDSVDAKSILPPDFLRQ